MTPPLLSASDPSSVERLGERIADIAAGIHAATYQLLVLLYEFDERKGWNNGFLSCAHWLSWRTSINPGAAREKVRVARALPQLPLLSGALQRGEISYAKVRALTRIATPATEERLLTVAYHGTAAQVERLVRAWRRCDRLEDERKQLHRSVTSYVDEDGMVILRARLTPEQGAVVQKALEAASDHLYRESRQASPADNLLEEVSAAQRRADALALIAESGLSCDASVVEAGLRTRTIPARLRRSLVTRDGHCTFPGCEARRCDAHHVVHWADGGPTVLDNLVLLCRRHHTLVHDGDIGIEWSESGETIFRRPGGRKIERVPPLAWSGVCAAPESVGGRSLRRWDGTPFNVGYAIDVLHPRANPAHG